MQWSLEDIYKKQVRGNIPPRKHLDVLGEAKLVIDLGDGVVKETEVDKKAAAELANSYNWVDVGREKSIKDILDKDIKVDGDRVYYNRRGPDGKFLDQDQWKVTDKEMAKKMFNDIFDKCKNSADPAKCYQRLMTGVGTSSIIGTFNDFLTNDFKQWNHKAVPKYSEELAALIAPHAGRGSDKVEKLDNFLKNIDSHPTFETTSREKGNLIKDFKKIKDFDISQDVIKSLMSHTGQDERKRGVGMAELGMSLLFKNIGSATGAGDLAVLGIGEPDSREGFEIKGHGAILGDQPEKFKLGFNLLAPFGITAGKGKTGTVNALVVKGSDKKYILKDLAEALADVYNNVEKLDLPDIKSQEEFKEAFKDVLFNAEGKHTFTTKGGEDVIYDQINFSNPQSINTGIGLMNFARYAAKEGFTHFMAHDFGTVGETYDGEGGPPRGNEPKNTGEYVYVTGTPYEMAQQLGGFGKTIGFENISPSNVRPRIGLTPTSIRYTSSQVEEMGLDPLDIPKKDYRVPEKMYGRPSVLSLKDLSDEQIQQVAQFIS